MIDGTFVAEIAQRIGRPQVITGITEGGKARIVAPDDWSDITPRQPAATPLELTSLGGLRDYLKHNVDGLVLAEQMVHVADPCRVAVLDQLEDEEQEYRRNVWAVALAVPASFRFGQYLDAEMFMVGLQTCFAPTAERDALVELIGSIREADVRETFDDGLAQEVKTARGVALVDRTRVPNPVVLAPYRTFREIEQPASAFVLRLRGGTGGEKPSAALFEADGGIWRIEAVAGIAAWLRAQVDGVAVIA